MCPVLPAAEHRNQITNCDDACACSSIDTSASYAFSAPRDWPSRATPFGTRTADVTWVGIFPDQLPDAAQATQDAKAILPSGFEKPLQLIARIIELISDPHISTEAYADLFTELSW